MKLRTVFISLLLLAFSLACVCGGSGTTGPSVQEATVQPPQETPTPQGPDPAGQLTSEEDVVEFGPGLDALQQLLGMAPFFNGDVLRVTNGGQVLMELGNDMWLRLFNDTQLEVVAVEAAEGTPLDVRLFLEDGGFTGQLTAEGGQVQFETPNGVSVTIVGTTFFVGYSPEMAQTVVLNFEGDIKIDDGSSSYTLARDNMVIAPSGGPEPFQSLTLEQFEASVRRTDSPLQSVALMACPAIYAPAFGVSQIEGGLFEVFWDYQGGCRPYRGVVTARYLEEDEPFQRYEISESEGSIFDQPPVRCEGTYTLVYELTIIDALGQEVSVRDTNFQGSQITFLC